MSHSLNNNPGGQEPGEPNPGGLTPEQDKLLRESIQAAFEPVQTMSTFVEDTFLEAGIDLSKLPPADSGSVRVPTLPSAWPGLDRTLSPTPIMTDLKTYEEITSLDPKLPDNVENGLFDILDQGPDGVVFAEVMGKARELLARDGKDRFLHYIRLTGDGGNVLETLFLARACKNYLHYPGAWAWEGAPADILSFKEARSWDVLAPVYNGIAKMAEDGADPKAVRALVGLAAHLECTENKNAFSTLVETLDELGRCEQNVPDGVRADELILPSCGAKALDLYVMLTKPVPNYPTARDINAAVEQDLGDMALAGDELAGALSLRSLEDRIAGRKTNLSLEGAQLGAAGWLFHYGGVDRSDAERAAGLLYESHFGREEMRNKPEFYGNARPGEPSLTRLLYMRAGVWALSDDRIWEALKGGYARDLSANALAAIGAALEDYENSVASGNPDSPTDLRGDRNYSPYAGAMNHFYRMVSNPKDELKYSSAGVDKAVMDLFVKHIQEAQRLGITWNYW